MTMTAACGRHVVVPVRIVAAEAEDVRPEQRDQRCQLSGIIRLIARLGREQKPLVQVFARRLAHPRHLMPQPSPGTVHAVEERRHPQEAVLGKDELEVRKFLQRAAENEASHAAMPICGTAA